MPVYFREGGNATYYLLYRQLKKKPEASLGFRFESYFCRVRYE